MAHFLRLLKARRLKKKWIHLIEEKQLGLTTDETDFSIPKGLFSKKVKRKLKDWALGRFLNKLRTSSTIENVVWKSFLGFVGGVLLTYIFFFFFYVGVSFSLKSTTYICGLAGIVLCLGLAFSSKVRCYVFLLLPVFFSRQGRQALLVYALFLAFTGPGRNTMHNMAILSDSMTCGQEMVRRTLRQIIEIVKTPFRSVKETIQKITKSLKEVIDTVKEFIMKIKRIIISVLNVIKKATTWLGSIINFCNKKIGTPFQRCMKAFDDAITDCKAKLGVMDFLCHVVHLVKALCYTVKWLDFICMFTDFVSEKIIGVVKRKLKEFGLHMKNLFYVSIELSHSYEFETIASNSTKHIAKTILQKISAKVERLQNIFSVFGFIFSFFFLFVFFKVYYYKYKYLSSDRFDNLYISKYIIELDMKRAKINKETVLPLEPREKKIYAKPTSVRLLKDEKFRMAKSMFLLSLTSFKVISFVVCDYSLFWVLITIYEAGLDVNDEVETSKLGIHVEGKGVLADFYRKLGKTLSVPENPDMHLTPLHCLPDPLVPDTGRYIQIGFLVILCWLLTVTEAYGLRLRNIVMSHYYPDRARERAVWLYNHILRSRGSFIRFARRQLRRKFQSGDGPAIEKVTLTQRLFASFPLLGAIFGIKKENTCLLCGATETKTEPLKRCRTPDCPGRYCLKCFASLENICTICQHPIEYGDVSDISEEIDSSEEEFYRRTDGSSVSPYNDSDTSKKEEKFMTFKDLELRDRFKDIEANKMIDYVKLGDLYNDKEALKKKLKEALLKRLKTLEMEKNRSKNLKETDYKRLKLKMQELKNKLWKNKLQRLKKAKTMKDKFMNTIKTLKKHTRNKEETEYENLLDEGATPTKSRVSFDLKYEESVPQTETKNDYKRLKNELKKKIRTLKERKKFKEINPIISQGSKGNVKSDYGNEESDRNNKDIKDRDKSSLKDSEKISYNNETYTYYFIQRERDVDFYTPELPYFDENFHLNTLKPIEELYLEDDSYYVL